MIVWHQAKIDLLIYFLCGDKNMIQPWLAWAGRASLKTHHSHSRHNVGVCLRLLSGVTVTSLSMSLYSFSASKESNCCPNFCCFAFSRFSTLNHALRGLFSVLCTPLNSNIDSLFLLSCACGCASLCNCSHSRGVDGPLISSSITENIFLN